MNNKKIRIALVNQRYGLEVNGGSEYYTRQLAEHLKENYDVEVLTTKAIGYDTWEDYYQEDKEIINGIVVRRFGVSKKRDVLGTKIYGRLLRYSPIFREYLGNKWIDAQGPYSPKLVEYIRKHSEDYTVFIFVTYLYYHTVRGVAAVAEKAVLLPTAHDEPYIYFKIFKRIFTLPKGIIYLTPEEKEFVENLFPVASKPSCICGSGVDLPEKIDNQEFRKKYKVYHDYFIYVGRIEISKGCGEMFRVFKEYKQKHPEDTIKLILMGKAMMPVPKDDDILSLGFVSEEDKFNGISGAKALWLPSRFESLSIAVLEALSLGVPVLVNGKCEVLKGHCLRSHAGFYYLDEKEALESMEKLSVLTENNAMSENAKKYITENYQWSAIVEKIGRLFSVLGLESCYMGEMKDDK